MDMNETSRSIEHVTVSVDFSDKDPQNKFTSCNLMEVVNKMKNF
jgi:hypothetical protein